MALIESDSQSASNHNTRYVEASDVPIESDSQSASNHNKVDMVDFKRLIESDSQSASNHNTLRSPISATELKAIVKVHQITTQGRSVFNVLD